MNFSTLGALDRRILITAGLATITGVISFMDTSGDWGIIMVVAIAGGLLGLFVALQPQIAPTTRLPMTRGLAVLVAGAAATAGFAIAMLNYIGYISRNITDIYVLLMIVGLVSSIVLLWTGWQLYQAEPKAGAATPTVPPTAQPTPPAAQPTPPADPPSAPQA